MRSVATVPCDRSARKPNPVGAGRSACIPQEGLLQEARALQDSAAFAPYRALRQARYRGRLKTQAQLLLAATVANLTRLWAAAKETPPVLCPGT